MNWPFESKLVKELNQTAYDRVYDYMQSHAHEFLLNNEKTHKRAQAIADAVNAEDPSKCGADSVLAENIIACIKSMREHIVDYYPNAIVACGHDPSVLFMLVLLHMAQIPKPLAARRFFNLCKKRSDFAERLLCSLREILRQHYFRCD